MRHEAAPEIAEYWPVRCPEPDLPAAKVVIGKLLRSPLEEPRLGPVEFGCRQILVPNERFHIMV